MQGSEETSPGLRQKLVARALEGKLAVITGASKGIGAAIAENLGSKGCSLVLNYSSERSSKQCIRLVRDLEAEYGIKCFPIQADLSLSTGPAELIAAAKSHFIAPESEPFRIDILVNNAGVVENAPVGAITTDQYEKQYGINVLAPVLLLQAALDYLPHDRSGRIINVSSISSSEGFRDQTIYGGTKAALEAMTRTWARELAERCTVNAVNPGPVATDMWSSIGDSHKGGLRPWVSHTPLAAVRRSVDDEAFVRDEENVGGRPAYAMEIAGVVGMLCTGDAGFVTGQVICANGGMRM